MVEHFQGIFNKQNIENCPNCIADILLGDNDSKPYGELLRRQFSEELKQELEGPLIQTELKDSLFNDIKPNSAPGINGFTVKFIRTFWPALDPLITAAVNKVKRKGKLTTTLRTAIMILLQEGNKEPTNPNSFRPISLLLVIYKIASCAISNIIKKTLPVIIGK